jgi:hypothetical protein
MDFFHLHFCELESMPLFPWSHEAVPPLLRLDGSPDITVPGKEQSKARI